VIHTMGQLAFLPVNTCPNFTPHSQHSKLGLFSQNNLRTGLELKCGGVGLPPEFTGKNTMAGLPIPEPKGVQNHFQNEKQDSAASNSWQAVVKASLEDLNLNGSSMCYYQTFLWCWICYVIYN
jgi:hypothetical protein